MLTGVIVARREVVEQNPAAVNAFLQEYAASVNWVNENTADAAALIGEYGIVDAAVAGKGAALLQHRLHHRQRDEGKSSGYLQVLLTQTPPRSAAPCRRITSTTAHNPAKKLFSAAAGIVLPPHFVL